MHIHILQDRPCQATKQVSINWQRFSRNWKRTGDRVDIILWIKRMVKQPHRKPGVSVWNEVGDLEKQHHRGHYTRGGDSEGWQAPEFWPQTPLSHAIDNHVPFSIMSRWRALSRARISKAGRMKDQVRPISGVSCKSPRSVIYGWNSLRNLTIDFTLTPDKAASTSAGYCVKKQILITSEVAWESAFPKVQWQQRCLPTDHSLRRVEDKLLTIMRWFNLMVAPVILLIVSNSLSTSVPIFYHFPPSL